MRNAQCGRRFPHLIPFSELQHSNTPVYLPFNAQPTESPNPPFLTLIRFLSSLRAPLNPVPDPSPSSVRDDISEREDHPHGSMPHYRR